MSIGLSGVAPADYKDLFGIIATSSATLTGLLFVALSVSNTRAKAHPVIREFRAAAALLAFTNALAVSLFALVPGTNVGYPAVVLGVTGVFFTGAGIRTSFALHQVRRQRHSQLYLIVLLLLAFGVEFGYGLERVLHPHRRAALAPIGYVLIASLHIGIARAWELVGDRDTGILSSLAVLLGRKSMVPGPSVGDGSAMPDVEDGSRQDPL